MPSVDVIRNITIKGKADGVDDATAALNRLTDSIKAANDNLAKSTAVAQDNSAGWRITGEGAATAANHLRQAAEAAYAFSPAFRGVVNEMAVPALSAAGTALAAIATGMVTATNYAGTGIIAIAGAAERASPSLLGLTTGVRSAGIAMEGFSPTVGTAAGSLLSFLSPALKVLGWVALIYDGIKLVGQAWQLGGEKLAEYVALSEKAAASGLTAEFFQRISKAAEDAKLPVDALTAALKKLNESTAGKLGGSAAQLAINPLEAAGNFGGNSGTSQLQSANSTEEKFRAVVSLWDQAIAKGERLAGIEVVRATLGDEIAKKAALDSGYLDKMVVSTDAISKDELVSSADVANAVELQNRLDAAEKILSQRWHPIQDLLTSLGIKFREAWVTIVELTASAFDNIAKMVEKLGQVPAWFQEKMNQGATAFMNLTTTPESRATAEKSFGISSDQTEMAAAALEQQRASAQGQAQLVDARRRLAEGMNRKFDTSKPLGQPETGPDTSAFDRAEEALRKYSETTLAAASSIDMTTAAQERLKAIAQLTAAGMKDGLTREAAAAKAQMSGLAEEAAKAADALAKAQVASEIRFGRNTALLSAEDVSIATRLKGLYPDVATALNGVEASGMRANNAFKEMGTAIETNLTSGLVSLISGTKSVSQSFRDMGLSIVTAIEQMVIKIAIVTPLMRALQSAAGGLFGGGTATAGVDGLAAIHHAGGIAGDSSMPTRYIHPAYFDSAPRFHSGGIAGDEVPIIARRGEGVFTPAQMAAMGGGSQVNVNVMNFGNDNVSVNQKQNGAGGIDLEVMVGQAAASQMAKKGSALRQVTDQRARVASR